MCPEIEYGTPYSPAQGDIFALGVVLFIMKSGHPPFVQATGDDQYYKQVLNNRLDKFWKAHISCKEENDYTNEFMELVSLMIQSDQAVRPTIEEIKASKWFNGSVPSVAQISDEFKERKSAIDQTSSGDAPEANHNIFEQEGHRGTEDEIDFDKLQIYKYYPDSTIHTRFFSTTAPLDLYAVILEFCKKL